MTVRMSLSYWQRTLVGASSAECCGGLDECDNNQLDGILCTGRQGKKTEGSMVLVAEIDLPRGKAYPRTYRLRLTPQTPENMVRLLSSKCVVSCEARPRRRSESLARLVCQSQPDIHRKRRAQACRGSKDIV